jgi:hypothetical protein
MPCLGWSGTELAIGNRDTRPPVVEEGDSEYDSKGTREKLWVGSHHGLGPRGPGRGVGQEGTLENNVSLNSTKVGRSRDRRLQAFSTDDNDRGGSEGRGRQWGEVGIRDEVCVARKGMIRRL